MNAVVTKASLPQSAELAVVGPTEIILLVLILVLFFGAKKIPLIARGLGEGIRNFRGAVKEDPNGDPDRLADPDSRD